MERTGKTIIFNSKEQAKVYYDAIQNDELDVAVKLTHYMEAYRLAVGREEDLKRKLSKLEYELNYYKECVADVKRVVDPRDSIREDMGR